MLKLRPQSLLATLSLVSLSALPGCVSLNSPTPTTGTTTASTICAAVKVVRYSAAHDTPETVEQIIPNNAALRKLCPSG